MSFSGLKQNVTKWCVNRLKNVILFLKQSKRAFSQGKYLCCNSLSAYSGFPKGWGAFSKYFRNVNTFFPQIPLINV